MNHHAYDYNLLKTQKSKYFFIRSKFLAKASNDSSFEQRWITALPARFNIKHFFWSNFFQTLSIRSKQARCLHWRVERKSQDLSMRIYTQQCRICGQNQTEVRHDNRYLNTRTASGRSSILCIQESNMREYVRHAFTNRRWWSHSVKVSRLHCTLFLRITRGGRLSHLRRATRWGCFR